MKVSKRQLQTIIKEEKAKLLQEDDVGRSLSDLYAAIDAMIAAMAMKVLSWNSQVSSRIGIATLDRNPFKELAPRRVTHIRIIHNESIKKSVKENHPGRESSPVK